VNLMARATGAAEEIPLVYGTHEIYPPTSHPESSATMEKRSSCWGHGKQKASAACGHGETRAESLPPLRRAPRTPDPNAKLPNSLVYTPIEDWSNDDVGSSSCSQESLGHTNKSLLTMYQGRRKMASASGLDSSTPSCGDSRFGC